MFITPEAFALNTRLETLSRMTNKPPYCDELLRIKGALERLRMVHSAQQHADVVAGCRALMFLTTQFLEAYGGGVEPGVQAALTGVLTLQEQVYRLGKKAIGRVPPSSVAYDAPMSSWSERIVKGVGLKVIKAYNQSKDKRCRPDDIDKWDDLVSTGWCYGMVISWLKCKREKRNFWEWAFTTEAEKVFRFNQATETMNKSIVSGSRNQFYNEEMSLKRNGFVRGAEMTEEIFGHSMEPNDVVFTIFESSVDYAFMTTYNAKGSHSTGLHITGPCSGSFFDPNIGELEFQDLVQLEQLFDRLFLGKYGPLTFYWIDLLEAI